METLLDEFKLEAKQLTDLYKVKVDYLVAKMLCDLDRLKDQIEIKSIRKNLKYNH